MVARYVRTASAVFILLGLFSALPAPDEKDKTIVDVWAEVRPPGPPALESVRLDPARAALLVLDIQNNNCNAQRRPRCVASLTAIRRLLSRAREHGVFVVYSLTSGADADDIRAEVRPLADDPVVRASVDKFFGTDLGQILHQRKIGTVIIVGTSAHGAVLHTATGAAVRGLRVVVPVDGMSADEYPEQYTAWHLVNAPGTRRQATLTTVDRIRFQKETVSP